MNKHSLTRLFSAVTLAAIVALLLAPRTAAQTPAPEKTVTLNVATATFDAVISLLVRQTGIDYVVHDDGKPYKPVTLHLVDMPLSKALRVIAQSAGMKVSRGDDGVYLFERGDENAALPLDAPEPPKLLAVYRQRLIVLQWVPPGYVLKLMRWSQPAETATALDPFHPVPKPGLNNAKNNVSLPTGVEAISASPDNNALLVSATEEGFNQVKQIVHVLDILPRLVQLKVMFASVPNAKARFTWSEPITPEAAHQEMFSDFLAQLTKSGAKFSEPMLVTTTNNVSVIFACADFPPLAGNHSNPSKTSALSLTPRINNDDTVMVAWHYVIPGPQALPVLQNSSIETLRTVRSGDMMIYDATGWNQTETGRLFLCITPTIVTEISPAAQPVKVTP